MKHIPRAFGWLVPALMLMIMLPEAASYGEKPAESRLKWESIDVEARRVLTNFKEEQLKLQEREKLLDQKENELKILRQEVDKKLEALKTIRKELEQLLAAKEQVENDKVKKLTKIYEKRDPAGAAKTLAAMEKNLAVSVLSRMNDKKAGAILDNMEETRAVEYSTALGRLRR